MSSPVKLAGPSNQSTRPRSISAPFWAPDRAQARVAGRGRAAAERVEHIARARPRDADHGDGREARAARRRDDGVGMAS